VCTSDAVGNSLRAEASAQHRLYTACSGSDSSCNIDISEAVSSCLVEPQQRLPAAAAVVATEAQLTQLLTAGTDWMHAGVAGHWRSSERDAALRLQVVQMCAERWRCAAAVSVCIAESEIDLLASGLELFMYCDADSRELSVVIT
jgi:hypothetical protein